MSNKPPPKHTNIYSVKKNKPTHSFDETVPPCNLPPFPIPSNTQHHSQHNTNHTTILGTLDQEFTRTRPTYVQLLLRFTFALEPTRLVRALQSTLISFPSACGRRVKQENGSTILQGLPGIVFSAITIPTTSALLAKPPSPILFHTPDRHARHTLLETKTNDNQVLTLRLTTTEDGTVSALGVVFDHCLSDISGPALLLSHASYHYRALAESALVLPLTTLQPPPFPTHDRTQQTKIQLQQDLVTDSTATTAPTATKEDEHEHHEQKQKPGDQKSDAARPQPKRLKGGVACVEITYSAKELKTLQMKYQASSKHVAAYTDVVLLLKSSGQHPIQSATISRNDRRRAGIDVEHFGNGVVMVEANLSIPTESGEDEGIGIANSLQHAICNGMGRHPQTLQHADVHLNTWWHPLQRDMSFRRSDGSGGEDSGPVYDIGPGSLCAFGQICVRRNGQPNVTVVPNDRQGGLKIYVLAKLKVAYNVAKKKGLVTKT